VKNILIGVIILIFISLHASGQQAQDTLYLKNGNSAVGKFLWESKEECRFKTSEGIYFSFSPDEVEKIVIAPKMIMRKVNPDTLNADQLNLYNNKAVKMRNTGRVLTISGVSIIAAGIVTGVILMNTGEPTDDPEDKHGPWLEFSIIGIAGVIGIPCTLVGVPLWSVGGSRKAKAEVALQKFNIAPEGSMVLGLGITIRF
jgi:hypothetical protein